MAGMTSVPSLDDLGATMTAIVESCTLGDLIINRHIIGVSELSASAAAFQAVELLELEAWHE